MLIKNNNMVWFVADWTPIEWCHLTPYGGPTVQLNHSTVKNGVKFDTNVVILGWPCQSTFLLSNCIEKTSLIYKIMQAGLYVFWISMSKG